MPLTSSRLSKPSEPSTPAPAAGNQNVSPRRRGGLTPAAAGASAAVAPRSDALDEETPQGAVQDPPADEEQTPPADTVADTSQAPAPTAKIGRPAGARDRAPRAPRAPVELPEDAATSDDPVILRRVLTGLDQDARTLKAEYDARLKELDAEFNPRRDALRAQYKAVSAKLANVMF